MGIKQLIGSRIAVKEVEKSDMSSTGRLYLAGNVQDATTAEGELVLDGDKEKYDIYGVSHEYDLNIGDKILYRVNNRNAEHDGLTLIEFIDVIAVLEDDE